MAELHLDEARVKELFKAAVREVLLEQRELIYEVLAEVIEDIAMARAIKEGEASESVTREEVFKVL